jgi:hypothetical protein
MFDVMRVMKVMQVIKAMNVREEACGVRRAARVAPLSTAYSPQPTA